MNITIRPILAQETLPLRSGVLRPGRPMQEAIFAGDDAPDTLHLGLHEDAQLIGVASLYRATLPGAATATIDTSWQLRGMAVDPARQREGYGKALVAACIDAIIVRGGTLLWCNARIGAVKFYEAMGFATQGEEFVIPDVGPHFVMLHYL